MKVPAGVTDGTRLRLRRGSGEPAGYARIRLAPDPWFSREGRDLVLRVPLGVAEAALGTVLVAQLPDGPVEITVPPGTCSGTRLRLAGRGVPGPERGDLIAAVEVVVPQDPSSEERAALQALAEVESSPREGWPAATSASSEGPAPPPSHAEQEPEGQEGGTHVDDAI